MTLVAERHAEGFLLRLRKKDTPTGISGETLKALIEATGLSKTELAHLALRKFADIYLPHYEEDDGALTEAQLQAIRKASSATDIAEEAFNHRLF